MLILTFNLQGMSAKTQVLNHRQIHQKIHRIAHQLLEENFSEQKVLIVGIADRGFVLAERIAKVLETIAEFEVQLHALRFDKDGPLESNYDHQLKVDNVRDCAVILVDDVLNTGRTLIYGAQFLLQFPLKKLTTVVMVDRRHRKFPIRADIVGLTLATTMQEHISVEIGDEEDAVYLT